MTVSIPYAKAMGGVVASDEELAAWWKAATTGTAQSFTPCTMRSVMRRLFCAEAKLAQMRSALAGVMPLTSYGPEGKSPPDELAAIAAGRAALDAFPDCGAKADERCGFNARGLSCPDVLRPSLPQPEVKP